MPVAASRWVDALSTGEQQARGGGCARAVCVEGGRAKEELSRGGVRSTGAAMQSMQEYQWQRKNSIIELRIL